jgi:hypothetical protein
VDDEFSHVLGRIDEMPKTDKESRKCQLQSDGI